MTLGERARWRECWPLGPRSPSGSGPPQAGARAGWGATAKRSTSSTACPRRPRRRVPERPSLHRGDSHVLPPATLGGWPPPAAPSTSPWSTATTPAGRPRGLGDRLGSPAMHGDRRPRHGERRLRAGIKQYGSTAPQVVYVDLDFVPGRLGTGRGRPRGRSGVVYAHRDRRCRGMGAAGRGRSAHEFVPATGAAAVAMGNERVTRSNALDTWTMSNAPPGRLRSMSRSHAVATPSCPRRPSPALIAFILQPVDRPCARPRLSQPVQLELHPTPGPAGSSTILPRPQASSRIRWSTVRGQRRPHRRTTEVADPTGTTTAVMEMPAALGVRHRVVPHRRRSSLAPDSS